MSTHTAGIPQAAPTLAAAPRVTPRKARPVVWWAAAGVAWLALIAYEWTKWLVEGYAKASPTGPDHMPGWMSTALVVLQVVAIVGALAILWFFVVRPKRRNGRFGTEALMLLGFVSIWMSQDPWINYVSVQWNMNANLWNIGCPQCMAPGWASPNPQNMSEPLFVLCVYLIGLFGITLILNEIMGRVRVRRPETGMAGLVGVCVVSATVLDVLMESVWMHTGAMSYFGADSSISLFSGKYYQLPIWEIGALVAQWTCMACFLFFRNDLGQTAAERGLERVNGSPARKQAIRVLAIIGMMNTMFLFAYNLPLQYFGLHADAPLKSVENRSYFLNGMCGKGTDYACPGKDLPLPVGQGIHFRPDGSLAVPEGTSPASAVRRP